MSNPSATATQEIDQVVEGNINIKKLSKNRYKIAFSKIRKFLLYQVLSDSSKQLNDNRSVYYLKAKDWVLSNFPTSKTNPYAFPYEPTTVLVINNKRRYIFVIKNAKIKKNGKIVFDVSTDEIKLQSNISKKLLHLPEGCFKNARFDIDSYNFVAGCPGCGPNGSPGCNSTCCAPGYPTPPPFCHHSPPPPPQPQLSNFIIQTQYFAGDPPVVQITQPTSNSSGAFTYSSSNSTFATVYGSIVTFLTIGTVTITATQEASGNYSQGSIETTVTVELQPGVTLFNGANFVGANLSNLTLSNFDFGNSNFTNANLTNANLTSTNLTNVNLTSANLTSANLTSANLTSANFTGANFTNATLTNATLTNTITLTSVIFVGANLSNVDLSNYDFENYNLTNTNFTSANLTSANLTSANLTSANLTSVNLTSANLTNATLTNATLTGAIFVGTNLSNMDFSNYDFENYNFSNANLTNANLTSVNFRSANLTSANLTNANMYQAVINYSNINNANFSGTNLFGIIGYWNSNPTPLNLDKAIAITSTGNITGGWTFVEEGGAWTLNNNNLN